MRDIPPERLERGRIVSGDMASDASYGMAGAFVVMGPKGEELRIISSGVDRKSGWEHVSVSTVRRTPNWAEMCFVKDMFWNDDECVVQFHPPRSDYVNYHPYCLHLWKQIGVPTVVPPALLVGPKEKVT
jgi:hypothetical protein